MKGLWLEDGKVEVRNDLRADPAPGEALLAVRMAGVCGTDLAMVDGYADFAGVPGHEFVAEVLAGDSRWVGKRVVAGINVSCGKCDACQRGMRTHCEVRTVIGIRSRPGAFAEQIAVPEANLLEVPAGMDDSVAVLAEPVAAALEIKRQIYLTGQERVLVVGAGRLGQLVAQILAGDVRSLDVLVRSAVRREQLSSIVANLVDEAEGVYDLVVECSGNPAGFEVALSHVRPRGTLVLKSTYATPITFDVSALVVNEVNVVGSRCGPMDEALQLLAAGGIRTESLPIERFTLDAHALAFAAARDPDVYKVVFEPTR